MIAAIEQLEVRDTTGQKSVHVSDVPTDATVGELVRELVPRMGLPATDPEGRPVSYHVHLEREGRHLRESEVAGDTLKTEDRLVLRPHVVAGFR